MILNFSFFKLEHPLSRSCPYLDTIDRSILDFDFEKLCSVSLSNNNVYACLVCGKYFQGKNGRLNGGEWRREGGKGREGRGRWETMSIDKLHYCNFSSLMGSNTCVQVMLYSLGVSFCQLKACLFTIFCNWVAHLPNTHTHSSTLSRTWPALPCLHTQCPGEPPALVLVFV